MFSFLNSTVLFAAVAALIPLIIHLFSKRRVKVVEFSSLKHLKAMQRRQVRRLKIRQLLLLLLRMLIILAIVVAFARPTLQSGGVGSHASVSAVILLDNSGSMDRYVTDGNLFEIARQATGRVLETFGEADEVTLIPMAGGRDESLTPSSAALASERLEQIEIAYRPADLAATWEQASEILNNAANLNRELYLVTDRQQVNLTQEGWIVSQRWMMMSASVWWICRWSRRVTWVWSAWISVASCFYRDGILKSMRKSRIMRAPVRPS